ncbi:tetratricopeptide repeat protein [Iodobacter sp. CM08]|uniref:nuclear transport factor 2 family protein n=1 Tax=Iodobacter sp. CM08 TaxID=3085902 RepID=UPI0029827155|nr:tetratricopeptide repeat protein [Iodobacter sp. CM08]MDW5418203.1 tetratricopeptide repeat protein [Iodobacter sp. CM08]
MTLRSIALALVPLFLSLNVLAGDAEDIQQLLKSKQLPQALDRADKALIKSPKEPSIRFLRGIILTEMGRTDEGIKAFTQLSADNPQLPEPYNNLAVLYAQQNQLDKARAALLMAIQTNPAYATAHENLGDLYARLASQAYDKALQLEGSNPTVQTKLKMVGSLFGNPIAPSKASSAKVAIVTPAAKPADVVAIVTPTAKPLTTPSPVPAKPTATPAPVVKATPAPTLAPTPAPKLETHDADKQQIAAAVEGWAQAWSKQNVNGYLAAYGNDFKTPGGQKFSAWGAERRNRINSPKSIEVKISDLKIEINDDSTAKARFRQSYKASHLSSTTGKTLILAKSGGRWLIREERTGS